MTASSSWLWPPPVSALEHAGFVVAGLLVYVLVTRIGQQRRHPSAALAWVLSLLAFPYLALPLFLLLGSRKQARPLVPARGAKLPADGVPGAPVWALSLLAGLGQPEPSEATHVHFHDEGREALAALLSLIQQAREALDICTFVLAEDSTGAAVVDALQQAARRGVRVRLLLDAVGSVSLPARRLRALQAQGVAVSRFMPWLHDPRRGRSNLRNHRKFAAVDGRWLWSGGRNLADEYFSGQAGAPPWLDLSFTVEGPLALQAHRQFEQDWRLAGGTVDAPFEPPASRGQSLPTGEESSLTQWISSGPDHALDTLHALLMTAAYHAKERLWIVSPYVVPDEALLDACCTACYRGVHVMVLLPERSNHRLADIARERALRQLVRAGAEVRLLPRMVHAKAVVVDGVMALCGSLNFDARSLFLNYELMTAFYGEVEIARLAGCVAQWRGQGRMHDAQAPGWGRDVLEGLVRALAFQL